MGKRKSIIEEVEIVDLASKGFTIGKSDSATVLCKGAVPGDVVKLEVLRKRKGMPEGRPVEYISHSPWRVEPKCRHFEWCGGCNWQNLGYDKQLELKSNRVSQQIKSIGGVGNFDVLPPLGCETTFEYRNKLEFTFTNHRWLTPQEIQSEKEFKTRLGLGFHVPGRYDQVMHIDECLLQHSLHNSMRNFVFERARELGLSFNDPRSNEGLLRNVVFRNTTNNEWMVILIARRHTNEVTQLGQDLARSFAQIKSLWVIENDKKNDSYADCNAFHIHGNATIRETLKRADGSSVSYQVGPKSFFQTNSTQAEKLYQVVAGWANATKSDVVYDLYCGAGTIGLFIAAEAKQVIGAEYVKDAVADAENNAWLNGIENAEFFAGDLKDLISDEFFEKSGKPDIIITDPPRAGMHHSVTERLNQSGAKRIVYVSCDAATQARDIALLNNYRLVKIQPVDMFPHTSHMENVALLVLK
ncbi:MAG: 23S rRNA (uracil(1939)-C(5))-methyltransferase RlmD [Salibacteraceae bacterium]